MNRFNGISQFMHNPDGLTKAQRGQTLTPPPEPMLRADLPAPLEGHSSATAGVYQLLRDTRRELCSGIETGCQKPHSTQSPVACANERLTEVAG